MQQISASQPHTPHGTLNHASQLSTSRSQSRRRRPSPSSCDDTSAVPTRSLSSSNGKHKTAAITSPIASVSAPSRRMHSSGIPLTTSSSRLGSGEERVVRVRCCESTGMDIELCYSTFGDVSHPAVILVGGLNMQSHAWDEQLCEQLVQRGPFFVIRFDNRDIGHSTKIVTSTSPAIPTPSSISASCPSSSSPLQHQQDNYHSGTDSLGFPAAAVTDTAPLLSASAVNVGFDEQQSHLHASSTPARILTSPMMTSSGCTPSTTSAYAVHMGHRHDQEHPQQQRASSSVSPSRGPSAGPATPPLRNIVPWKLILGGWLKCLEQPLPYTLEDMALDALALLDVLGVERAHVIGISMGGMISQLMALLQPQRVRSLTCIMSSTNAEDLPHPALWVKLWMLRKPPKSSAQNRDELIEFRVKALQGLLYGCVPVDETYLKQRIALSLNRSTYADGLIRQAAAIMRARPRDDELKRVVTCPALVIHGQNDVLVRVEHGYRLGRVLRSARFVVFKNMGHYLNPAYFDAIVDEFLSLTDRAVEVEAAQAAREQRFRERLNAVSVKYDNLV